MRVALGFKSHSGWAVLVAVGLGEDGLQVVDRRRIELIEEGETWAKMPYHAAEGLDPYDARDVVERGRESAYRVARLRMEEAVNRVRRLNYELTGCGVLVPAPMPDWNTGDILAVHFRMHKAEGVLFPEALCRAAEECGLPLVAVPEKQIEEYSEEKLGTPFARSMETVLGLGKPIGTPWAKDQRYAALAAMIVLKKSQVPSRTG